MSLTVSEIFNGECDTMVDVTLIRPLGLNKVKVHWPSSLAFCTDETAGRSWNEDKIWRPKLCRPRTSYLEQSIPAELRAPDGFRDI